MKTKHLLSLFILSCMIITTYAQEQATLTVPYRQVIISETGINTGPTGQPLNYIELSNVGDSSVNLSDFYLLNRHSGVIPLINLDRDEEGQLLNFYYSPDGQAASYHARLANHILMPGESFVISNVWDGTSDDGTLIQREALVERTNMFVHRSESSLDTTIYNSSYPEFQNFDFDSVSPHYELLRFVLYSQIILSHRIYDTGGEVVDSMVTDVFQLSINPDGTLISTPSNISGVEEAVAEHIAVRKSNITHGNINWDISRGVSAEDSEWLVIPKWYNRGVWTTIGEHGDFSISMTSDALNIDMNAQKITVPWGTERGDSIIHRMELGLGMAWQYHEDSTNFEGLGQITCVTGDTLTMYATGETVEQISFTIEVDESAEDIARVFPKRILNYPDGIPTWETSTYYYTTRFETIMDTIGNVPYSTRADTLLQRLEKIPGAEWEIIWLDGDQNRIDLKNGDILRVTAKNGTTTKDYYIDVLPYMGSSNADLAAISWPDKPGFIDGWVQDTIPGFSPTTRNYSVLLPYNIMDVPALQVIPANINAIVKVMPAMNITGTSTERTTVIDVTSEDGMESSQYRVTFHKDKPAFMTQPFIAEPFFSELLGSQAAWNSAVEIYNPGTEIIDMSNYMLGVATGGTPPDPATYIQGVIGSIDPDNYGNRYMNGSVYVPGFKWPATSEDWELNPGKLVFDPVVNTILEPGETFAIGNGYSTTENLDAIIGRNGQLWGEDDIHDRSMIKFIRGLQVSTYGKSSTIPFLNGTKAIEDPADFVLVEFFGGTNAPWEIAGREISNSNVMTIIRKPHVYTPGTEHFRGWGASVEDSDWTVLFIGDQFDGLDISNPTMNFHIGTHFINEVTSYKSTILSNAYLVDDGYMGDLFINGVSNGENVETFLNNIIKADEDQNLKVYPAAGGDAKELSEAVETGDKLTVISADGENTTTYSIIVQPLDNQVELTAISGSSLVITGEDETGTISGFTFGATLQDIFAEVEKPEFASLRIINEEGNLVPLNTMNTDSLKVKTLALPGIYFKVIAQNGTDSRTYALQPDTNPSDAYVLSDVYTVLQDSSAITVIPFVTSVSTFLNNIYAASGGTITIYDRAGNERTVGQMNYDDRLVVTSQDGSNFKITTCNL
jgi:hypothetical protein